MTNHELLEHYNANDARYTATKFLKEDFGNMGPSAIADFRRSRNSKSAIFHRPIRRRT